MRAQTKIGEIIVLGMGDRILAFCMCPCLSTLKPSHDLADKDLLIPQQSEHSNKVLLPQQTQYDQIKSSLQRGRVCSDRKFDIIVPGMGDRILAFCMCPCLPALKPSRDLTDKDL